MSLIPTILRSMRPSSWMEHNLRMMRQMEKMMTESFPSFPVHPSFHVEWKDPWYSDEKAGVSKTPFTVKLDVKNFAPKEITVKTIDDSIIVEGKHEEESMEKGVITRHFVKTFSLPEGHEPEDVVSSLSPDGILTITAPNKTPIATSTQREIPIKMEAGNEASKK